jgi:predicted metal-dependent hydrolase
MNCKYCGSTTNHCTDIEAETCGENDECEVTIQRKEKEVKEAKEVMDVLGNYVNYRKSNKAFIEAFKREHRTLQQSAFKMMLELIEEMATENYHTDGRNEDSQKMAQQLIEGFKEAKKKEYLAQGVTEERAEVYINTNGGDKPSRYLPFV